jgi:hypothetical protein
MPDRKQSHSQALFYFMGPFPVLLSVRNDAAFWKRMPFNCPSMTANVRKSASSSFYPFYMGGRDEVVIFAF